MSIKDAIEQSIKDAYQLGLTSDKELYGEDEERLKVLEFRILDAIYRNNGGKYEN